MMLKRIINKLRRPNSTWKRFGNYCLNYISRSLRIPYALGFPESIFIEPTNICNLKCPLCPTGSGNKKREKGILALSNFKKIIDEIGEYLYDLVLTNYGEPFLNPQILEMVCYAKERRISTRLVTNALLITDVSAAGIVNTGLDSIVISLDGIDQEVYSSYRIGGQLSKVIEAVKLIVEEKNKQKKSLPSIYLQFIITKHNEHQIEAVRDLAKELKVDHLIFKRICDLNGFPSDLSVLEKFLPSNPAYRAYKVEEGAIRWNTGKFDINFCPMAWNYPAVNWDGSLFPCCFDYGTLDMGNVFEDSFKKVWNNRSFLRLRREISAGKKDLPVCGNCPINIYDDITKDIS